MRGSLEDPERFSVIFERHHRVIWTYIARLAGRDVADEIAGEVFTTAFAKRDRFDPSRGEVRSWLYGIASNMVRTRVRSEGRARAAFARAAAAAVTEVPDPTHVVVDADQLTRTANQVRFAVERLSRSDRELLVLYAWEQLSYAEIADVIQVPIGTVRSRLSRARHRLRELVGDTGQLLDEPTRN